MKFVVDRRPSKTALSDVPLWNVAETGAASTASETAHGAADDDMVVDDKQHKKRKWRISDSAAQDHSVEFSAGETTITSPAVDTSDNRREPGPQRLSLIHI